MSSGMGKALKAGAVGATAAVVGIVGTGLIKGFSRLQGIEQAESKLTGLGHSAKSVEKIMVNATDAVTGTAFGLDAAATVAASAVAAGVKPGKDLERTLSLVGDAATIAGTDMGEMGAIFNKVAASNKIQGDVIAQLNDAGIPIIQLLGKELGKSAEETLALASEGKVNFETFQKAMEAGLGGAAQESGKTFSGAMANMQAALGRLGARVLGGVFAQMPALFTKAGSSLDKLAPYADKVGNAIGRGMGMAGAAIRTLVARGRELVTGPAGQGLVKMARDVAAQVQGGLIPALAAFGAMIASNIIPAAQALGTALLPPIQAAATFLAANLVPAISSVVNFMVKWQAVIIPLAAGIGAMVLAFKIYKGTLLAITAVTKAYAAAQAALNVIMALNPIGVVVLALVGIGVALVVAYKKSETFRNIVNGAFNAVKSVVMGVVSFFTTKIPAAFNKVKSAAGSALGWVKSNWPTILAVLTGPFSIAALMIVRNWDKIKAGGVSVLNWIKGLPGQIKGAFSGAAGWLLSAGSQIIGGLLSGITSKFKAVKSKLGELTAMIPDWKGPAKRDKKLLEPVGGMIMDGLVRGLEGGRKRLKAVLTRVTKDIPARLRAGFNSSVRRDLKWRLDGMVFNKESLAKNAKSYLSALSQAVKKALQSVQKSVKAEAAKISRQVDAFKSLRDAVKSAFSPDLFSATPAMFSAGLKGQLGINNAVIAAVKKLKGMKLNPGFLSGLIQSGNFDLITAMAGAGASTVKTQQKDWLAVQKTAGQLGTMTAETVTGEKLTDLRDELKQLNRTVKKLDKAIGAEVGKAVNTSASNAKRSRR